MLKTCKVHGKTEFIIEGRGYARCKQCRIDHVTKRRKKMKQILVDSKGNQCSKCGYVGIAAVYDFHHRDPNKKDFSVSCNGSTKGIKKLLAEAEKCDLLCANCHREEHAFGWSSAFSSVGRAVAR
jgi:hypothetical protein